MRNTLLLLVPVALASCAAAPQPDSAPEPQDNLARAALGERVYVDGPYVTPLEVLEDSRCPVNARCVWAGRVRVSVKIDLGSGSADYIIGNDEPLRIADGYLSLDEIRPERVAGKPVAPAEYRFGFSFAGGL